MTNADKLAQKKIDAVIQKYSVMPFSKETLRNSIVEMGYAFVGVSEIGTTNTGFWVDKFNKDIGLNKVAWCVSFIQYIYKYSCSIWNMPDILPFNTGSSQGLFVWASKNKLTFTDYTLLKPADIVVWRNGAKSSLGHVGLSSKIKIDEPEIVSTTEGNTNSEFSRDGGDVCYHTANILRYGEIGIPSKTNPQKRYTRGFISFDAIWDFSGIIGTFASADAVAGTGSIDGAIASVA